jgi:hypothetical protein
LSEEKTPTTKENKIFPSNEEKSLLHEKLETIDSMKLGRKPIQLQ